MTQSSAPFSPETPVTLQYPHEKPDVSHWGGPIELVTFPETGTHDCIACNACIKTCPSRCMSLEVAKSAAKRGIDQGFGPAKDSARRP